MKHLILVLPLLALACSSPAGKGAKAGADAFLHCEKVNLEAVVDQQGGTLLGRAADIVIEGGTGWQGYLEDLGVKVGETSLACAVEAIRAGLVAARGARFEIAPDSGVGRATEFIQAHGWRFPPPAAQ